MAEEAAYAAKATLLPVSVAGSDDRISAGDLG